MRLKRALMVALIGVALAVGVAQAGYFYQNGRWYYTPDVGVDQTYKGVQNPDPLDPHPAYIQWTLTTGRYGCACRNNGGNFASEVVSVEQVVLTASDQIDKDNIVDKTKGIAKVSGHIETEALCSPALVTCQNPNWYVDPDFDLIYAFKSTSEAFVWDKKANGGLGAYKPVSGSRQNFDCELSDLTASPLNLPAPGTPYNCF